MATKKKPRALADLASVTDPTAPIDSPMLLKAAQPVLKQLEGDLTQRAKGSPAVTLALKARHKAEQDARRTADAYPQWLEHFVEQVAAAWLLSCVFVRILEDRGLLGQHRLAGPGAADSQRTFFSSSRRNVRSLVAMSLQSFLPVSRGTGKAPGPPAYT